MQIGEITMVDGTDSVWGSVEWGGGPRRESARSAWGHTLFVIIWYLEGLGVCVNYILAQIWIAYLRVSFPGGQVDGRRVGEEQMTVERADWLVGHGRKAGRQSGRSADGQTGAGKKLARHHDGRASKPVQEGKRITTVDGITGEG